MPTARQQKVLAEAEARKLEEEKKKAAAEEEKRQREELKKQRQREKQEEEERLKAEAEAEKAAAEKEAAEKAAAAAEEEAKMDLEEPTAEATAAAINGDPMEGVQQGSGAAPAVTPNVNTNEHIQEMNEGGDPEEEEEEETSSPIRKKRKKSKKKEKKRSSSLEEPPSILKKGKVGQAIESKKLQVEEKLKTAVEKRKDKYERYAHTHERVIITATIVCSQSGTQAKMSEFIMGGRALLKNLMKVDKTVVLEPEREGVDERIYDPTQLPLDLTEAGAWMRPSGNAGVFEMRKPKKNDKDKKNKSKRDDDEEGEEAMIDPEVWTQLCISCDEDPEELLSRCSFEWKKIGGNRLQVKEIAAFATRSAATFYYVRSDANLGGMKHETTRMLLEARERGTEKVQGFYPRTLPDFALKTATPRIRTGGRRCTLTLGRKTWHMHELVNIAKDYGIVGKYFGSAAKAAIVVEKQGKGKKGENEMDMAKYDLAAIASFSKHHVNYQKNTLYDGVKGIVDLDRLFDIWSVTEPRELIARVSLRTIMYTKIKLGDLPLFMEVHQGQPMMPVDVVIGNWEEAERMMLMINKNPAAYFYYYLQDKAKINGEWLMEVLKGTMDPILVDEIGKCSWDSEKLILTTPQDEENAKLAVMENAARYKDEFGGNVFDMDDKEKKEFSTKEQMEDLYEEKSYQTVTRKKDGTGRGVGFTDGEAAIPQAATKEGDDGEDLSKLTKEQLIQRLMRKAEISSNSGSLPSGSNSAVDAVGSVDGSDDSSSGSSSSSSSSSEVQEIPPLSDGGNTAGLTSARSE
eukprot:scaffold56619_cov40-Cyclotella_meneghiniana.AAC.2